MKKSVIALLVLILAIGGFMGAKYYGEKKAREIVDDEIAQASMFAKITYEDISFNPLTFKTTLEALEISPPGATFKITAQSIVINKYDTKNSPPLYSDIETNGIFIDFADEKGVGDLAQAAAFMDKLGYDSVTMDIATRHTYKKEGKHLTYGFNLKVKDMGILAFDTALDNLDLSDNSMALFMDHSNVEIASAKVQYIDNSLVNRAIKMQAKEAGISTDEMMTMLNNSLDGEIQNEEDELGLAVLNALKKFLNKPGTYTITLNPEKPVPFMRFQEASPEDVLRELGMTVTAL